MKGNERIVKLLKQAKVFFFATTDSKKPYVRPFNVVMEYENKLYFYTNNHKSSFAQMNTNPNIELCAMLSENRWLRVNGKAVFDSRAEVKTKMFDLNPELKKIYGVDDKIFEVFYLEDMHAKIHSTYEKAETIC